MMQQRTNTISPKDAGCTCLDCKGQRAVYSPWVKRALNNNLPAKDLTNGKPAYR